MRILFGASNYSGSNIMLSRFINLTDHEVRIAAYYRNHQHLQSIDWCLDALYNTSVGDSNYFKEYHGVHGPYINHDSADLIINDLLEWKPDLVISDCEFFTAMVAKSLEVPLWYCSSMLQLVGIDRAQKEINTKYFDKYIRKINNLPKGDKYLVYSPLCDVQSRPFLKSGFEWVRPYSKKPDKITSENLEIVEKAIQDDCLVTTGETSYVSDCIYSGKRFYVSPSPMDTEQRLNAELCQWYGVASNIGRPKNIKFAISKIEKGTPKPSLSIQNWKQLDEIL